MQQYFLEVDNTVMQYHIVYLLSTLDRAEHKSSRLFESQVKPLWVTAIPGSGGHRHGG